MISYERMWEVWERRGIVSILQERYRRQIREWFDTINDNDFEPVAWLIDDERDTPHAVWLGSRCGLFPSGKVYLPWCSNQTVKDVVLDEIFFDVLESEAEIHCHTAETVLLRHRGVTILAGFDDKSYFATAIPEPAETIEEAIEALKPEIVRKAEVEGKEVLRQEEWFFIRVANLPKEVGLKDRDFKQRALPRLIGQSPHICRIALKNGKLFCTGLVRHARKEHTPLRLNGVYLAVRNKEMISSTANHRVD